MASATPPTVEKYMSAVDEKDYDALVATFTDDAAVIEEGNSYEGKAAIRAWREANSWNYTINARSVQV
jgi:ketosteroid isomerase-like protein